MLPEEFRTFLRRQPFSPFRVTLTDGRMHDVFHPELAIVGFQCVAIGSPPINQDDATFERLTTISLLHVMQIEFLEVQK